MPEEKRDAALERKMVELERRVTSREGVETSSFPASCLPVSHSSVPVAPAGASSGARSHTPGVLAGENSSCSLPSLGSRSAAGTRPARKRERPPEPEPPAYVHARQPPIVVDEDNGDTQDESAEESSRPTGASATTAAATAGATTTAAGGVRGAAPASKRKRTAHYTAEEDQLIIAGVDRYGEDWAKIVEHTDIHRAPNSIRKRYKVLTGGAASSSASNPGSSTAPAPPPQQPPDEAGEREPVPLGMTRGAAVNSSGSVIEVDSASAPRAAAATAATADVRENSNNGHSHGHGHSKGAGDAAALATPKKQRVLVTDYFTSPQQPATRHRSTGTLSSSSSSSSSSSATATTTTTTTTGAGGEIPQGMVSEREHEALKVELQRAREAAAAVQDRLQQRDAQYNKQGALLSRYRTQLVRVLKENAQRQRVEAMERVARNSINFGTVVQQRKGVEYVEVWKGGLEYRRAALRLREVQALREELESKRSRRKRGAAAASNSSTSSESSTSTAVTTTAGAASQTQQPTSSTTTGVSTTTTGERDEPDLAQIVALKVASLKKEEAEIQEEMRRIAAQRFVQIREMKRVADEESSVHNGFELLAQRYLLLNLLGKGGFSEVYSAFDLEECREVACKFHTLNPAWDEERKRTYIRHACREYNIHRILDHPKVVRLYDVFEINNDCFCTVLEMCGGGDLDSYIKQQGSLPEREARCIITQIFSGLVYLNSLPQPIIHYDLKPANILFSRDGEVKISDFGLSKIMDCEADSMELTSQGAGTYWYLPPECFETSVAVPKISPKVDVWSAGIIFYQMLYGRKPFGDKLSQEQFRLHNVARNATVEFPAKPAVSQESKDFIRRCLLSQVSVRPDARTCFADLIRKG